MYVFFVFYLSETLVGVFLTMLLAYQEKDGILSIL